MLGGFAATDSNTKVQVEILYKKGKRMGTQDNISHLNAQEAWVAYHQVLLFHHLYIHSELYQSVKLTIKR